MRPVKLHMERTIMNRVLNFAVVAVISSVAFAGVSRADTLAMNDGPALENTLRTYDKDFAIHYIYNYQEQQDQAEGPNAAPQRSPAAISNIQASISSNEALVKKLDTRGVAVKTIVNAEQAADGSLIFFVH